VPPLELEERHFPREPSAIVALAHAPGRRVPGGGAAAGGAPGFSHELERRPGSFPSGSSASKAASSVANSRLLGRAAVATNRVAQVCSGRGVCGEQPENNGVNAALGGGGGGFGVCHCQAGFIGSDGRSPTEGVGGGGVPGGLRKHVEYPRGRTRHDGLPSDGFENCGALDPFAFPKDYLPTSRATAVLSSSHPHATSSSSSAIVAAALSSGAVKASDPVRTPKVDFNFKYDGNSGTANTRGRSPLDPPEQHELGGGNARDVAARAENLRLSSSYDQFCPGVVPARRGRQQDGGGGGSGSGGSLEGGGRFSHDLDGLPEQPQRDYCSGHGVCSGAPAWACLCERGWEGFDCSLRQCLKGRSWFDFPRANDEVRKCFSFYINLLHS
jgi:hypothetical protein